MLASYKTQKRTTYNVSLSELSLPSKQESNLTNDLPKLFSNLRQSILKKFQDKDEIDFNISHNIEIINDKIQEITQSTPLTEIFDITQKALNIFINDLLSIKECPKILSNDSFRKIFDSLISYEKNFSLQSIYEYNPLYARKILYSSFDLLSSSTIIDFLNDNYPNELFSNMAYILSRIIFHMTLSINYIIFNKDDLQNQISNLRLLLEYVDKNKQNNNQTLIFELLQSILIFFANLSDKLILIPTLIQAKCSDYILKWCTMKDISIDIQHNCIHIFYNLARHEQGAEILNNANGINILKECQQRILKSINSSEHIELRLLYSMTVSLLTEPKENQEDVNNLREILDQLMQLVIDGEQSIDYRCQGFHISEPIVVLTKLFVHDKILKYVLNESSIKNMTTKSRLNVFCQLLMKFRGALASKNDLDQLLLTALFNIIWSISFHNEYIKELKSNSKFLITVKSLANDDGKDWIDQYVPKHMSSIPKAANGILWNLDENNPARTTIVSETKKQLQDDVNKTNRMRVMISYSHTDKDFCHQLVAALQKDFEYCHTEDLWEEIGQAIEAANVILFLMSTDYQKSNSCRQEVMYAKDSLKKRFIPIYIKKDFVATGWLGVRIVGPQYIRFEKKSFDDTIKDLIKLIVEDKKLQEPAKIQVTEPSTNLPSFVEDKPIENTNNQIKPIKHIDIKLNRKPSKKSVELWTKQDILQWFYENNIQQELTDLYDFQHGVDLLLYGQCLRPDWQIEYNAVSERYEQQYNTKLYRDQFVRFVGAIHRLQPTNSKLCIIS
ncbi:unnamed protein product [Rotaria sp. Silwood1]|nr:unnamed protein product [Rotaria sp. Silwood1]